MVINLEKKIQLRFTQKNLLKRIEGGPIILSGSNFEIMNKEAGVSIKEKEKYKTGGKDLNIL